MRGLLILLIGGTLIWFGLKSRADEQNETAPGFASRPAAEVAQADSAGSGARKPRPGGQEPPAAEPEGPAGPAGPRPEAPSSGADAGPAQQGRPKARKDRKQPPQEASGFDFTGEVADPVDLGERLVSAWLEENGMLIQEYLGTDGAGHAEARKQLLHAFWIAVGGDSLGASKELDDLRSSDIIHPTEVALLEVAIGEGSRRPMEASSRTEPTPIARAMSIVLHDIASRRAAKRSDHKAAAESLSDAILLEVSAPWAPHRAGIKGWAGELRLAQEGHRFDPGGDWPSIEHTVAPGENLISIRQKLIQADQDLLLCTGLIERANRLGKYIQKDQLLRIPTQRASVIIDLDARVLLYMHGGEVVLAWDVGIGKEGHETPVGTFMTGLKQENPSWMPIGQTPIPFGHPDNPLGTRWISWEQEGRDTSFGFHGTSEPEGVGGRVSKGCIRMRNEDVETLYDILPQGAEILVQR